MVDHEKKRLYIYFITYDIWAAHDGIAGCNNFQEKENDFQVFWLAVLLGLV